MTQPTVEDLVQSVIQASARLQELPRQLEIDANDLEDHEFDELRIVDESLWDLVEQLGL